jgi:cellulose synthase/poly-beta-1,6-N-acetylglucosamine synthase-like glycosyltransferase
MVVIFWLSCAAVTYVYVGYPLLLLLWARVHRRPVADAPAADLPGVSIVVAARNEGSCLAARVDNLLHLDYPAERRQIIVASDGSTDDSLAQLTAFSPAVDTIPLPAGGKALALNAGVARARFDLLVFADARQTFAPDALIELTRPFQDPRVGAVTGELLLDVEPASGASGHEVHGDSSGDHGSRSAEPSTIADGIGLYWRYEKGLRRLESDVWSTLGASGAIYAMRRSLWRPLPAGTLLDDVLAPMQCVLAGYRVVFSDRARAFDRAAPDAEAEAHRKIRTLAGNYQILGLEPRLLLPWRNPVWLQYLSHKVGRLVVPYALVGLMIASAALADRSPLYAGAFVVQCLFYLLAGYGAWLDRRDAAGRNARAPRHGGAVHA